MRLDFLDAPGACSVQVRLVVHDVQPDKLVEEPFHVVVEDGLYEGLL